MAGRRLPPVWRASLCRRSQSSCCLLNACAGLLARMLPTCPPPFVSPDPLVRLGSPAQILPTTPPPPQKNLAGRRPVGHGPSCCISYLSGCATPGADACAAPGVQGGRVLSSMSPPHQKPTARNRAVCPFARRRKRRCDPGKQPSVPTRRSVPQKLGPERWAWGRRFPGPRHTCRHCSP